MEHDKLLNGVNEGEIDSKANRVDMCPALVLIKASYNNKSCVSFIRDLDD